MKFLKFSISLFLFTLFLSNCKSTSGNKSDLPQVEIPIPVPPMASNSSPRPHLVTSFFGMADQDSAMLYTLKNNNKMEVRITNYGGYITNIIVPDKAGNPGDVVLGFNTLEGYKQKGNPFFGCLVGRYANRIAKASFTLDGVIYKLAANNGRNTLHGGIKGFDKKVWKTIDASDSMLVFQLISPDGEEGFPGTVTATVKYIISDDNQLVIDYTATTDKATPINLTNHTYFNLSAGKEATILNHELMLNAEMYTPVDDELIPTGKVAFVVNTPFDFAKSKLIGRDIDKVKGGYDHNFVLKGIGKAAEVYDPGSGRVMSVFTTCPGVQFYTGNFLNGSQTDTKGGVKYLKHSGFCLETQYFPDSPNQPLFPSCILRPGQTYNQKTSFQFSVR
ncbi:MAG: aldose epimerase family protein [Saprospiraceae bacterium]